MKITVHNIEKGYKNPEIITRVKYNALLDYWDGSNWSDGNVGCHRGLAYLRASKKYVLIHGSDWQGDNDYGEIISDRRAVLEILRYEWKSGEGTRKIIKKFPSLTEKYNIEKEKFSLEGYEIEIFSGRV